MESHFNREKGTMLPVATNELRVAPPQFALETKNIGPCSGYVLIDRQYKAAGLYHAPPYPELDQYQDELADFANGFCLPLHSGSSKNKAALEQFFSKNLAINVLQGIFFPNPKIDVRFTATKKQVIVTDSNTGQIIQTISFP